MVRARDLIGTGSPGGILPPAPTLYCDESPPLDPPAIRAIRAQLEALEARVNDLEYRLRADEYD